VPISRPRAAEVEKRLPKFDELDSVSQHPIAFFNSVHQNVCTTLGATRMKFSTSEIGISIDSLRSVLVNTSANLRFDFQ
jgi:hypothetical protein